MQASIRVIEKSTGRVLLNITGTQSGCLSNPQFKELVRAVRPSPYTHIIELFRGDHGTYSMCKTMHHRDGSYRGLSVISTSRSPYQVASAEETKAPAPASDVKARIERLLSDWDEGHRTPDATISAISLLRELKDKLGA